MEQISAPQEEQTGREVVEKVSADVKDPAESPPDSQQIAQDRIEEINGQMDKFDGQLAEFSQKLEDPDFDADAKVVVEKIMQKIAEQQTALVNEREEIKLTASQDAVALDLNKTQAIPALRRETALHKSPGAPSEKLHELPADALTELPPELPADALTPLENQPSAASADSNDLYATLEGVPADNLAPPAKKANPYGSPEGHVRDSRIEGDARQAKMAEEITRSKESIAPIVEARRKINEDRQQQQQAA